MKRHESYVFNFFILPWPGFNSFFVSNFYVFLSKSDLFINPDISDLFASSILN